MKIDKIADRIERALWQAGRSPEPLAAGTDWQAGVMAAIRRIGPLQRETPGRPDAPAASWAWAWAAALAACLAINIAWNAFDDFNAETVAAGLLLEEPADVTVTAMLMEL